MLERIKLLIYVERKMKILILVNKYITGIRFLYRY